ncbi:hypothetical protein CVU37_09885 [candidate division BRC1 bacterium HGW-BRC1-1]|jgi:hypothetical protein|nr:MAG: hypothetical protein CVU37_09885 [candidate division BRC1 bacterium HGW-BRC1-1]
MSNVEYIFTLPLLRDLGMQIMWLLLFNAALVTAIIYFACKADRETKRADALQEQLSKISREMDDTDPIMPVLPPRGPAIPLSDDHPIPLVKDARDSQPRR